MCGITIHDNQSILSRINHRGLKNQNKIVESRFNGERKYLYHTRLPIQTLEDDNWSQPIQTNFYKMLYNGEIFNYDQNKYENDTEYLIDFFNKYFSYDLITSEKCIREMNTWDGFWSIVLFSEVQTIIITDPLGKKQLYYDDNCNISSEVKSLYDQNTKLDNKTLNTIIKFGYNFDNKTCFSGIRRFMPNSIYRIYSRNKIDKYENYYDLFSYDKTTSLKEKIEQSVIRRCLSKKYKVGMLLSGGLDSTIISNVLIRNNYDVNFYTIENNENEYVEIVSNFYNIDVKYKTFEEGNELETLYYNDSPINLGSLFQQHEILSIIDEKIVITGDGADELFGGYKRIKQYDSQLSDVFDEISFYHLPRLDRASMRYTIELRSPFLGHDVVRHALNIPYKERLDKKILKDIFKDELPIEIINREKLALKSKKIVDDPIKERIRLVKMFTKAWEDGVWLEQKN